MGPADYRLLQQDEAIRAMTAGFARISRPVSVSYLALGADANVSWMCKTASALGGAVAFVQNAEDVPMGLEEILSFAYLQPQLVVLCDAWTPRTARNATTSGD